MDSFFGIGIFELFLIAVIALVVLGPERLPGAMRTLADYMRQIRGISSEFTSQFSEEIKMLEEMDPRRMINDALDPAKTPAAAKGAQPARPVQPTKPAQPAKPPAANASSTAVKATAAVAGGGSAVATAAAQANGEVENTILPPKLDAAERTVDTNSPAVEPESTAPEPTSSTVEAKPEGSTSAAAEAPR